MASIGRKLEKKGVIAMTLLTLVLIGTSCEDRIDNPAVHPSERETVEVALNIGVADEEDGYTLSTKSTTSSDKGAFNCQLQPATVTRGDASVKPDKLYNLEIQQYNQSGTRIGGMNSGDVTNHEIGSALTLSLAVNYNCQLVIVAWGNGNNTKLGTGDLASAQAKSLEASTISSLQPNVQDDMNKMPYVLHLKHVKVDNGTIKSIDGQDVRLLLKRLATRLTISWNYNVTGYTLKQIILQSIPLNYKVVAAPSENNTYPSEMDQYTNIQLTSDQVGVNGSGSYTRWIPANVRGFNTASNSPLYRIKANAPTGSAYASFIAVNDTDIKKKFNYRVYLGGKDYSDFNLYENTDYNYTVKIQHNGIPTNDRRVTYIDPIPASENNENFVNTANCFMVAPGGYFNFNPYNYYVNGKNKEGGNELLREWCKSSKIQSVKVLWQTLENGDLGDPVLGTVNAPTDHTNIVDLTNGDNFDNARIYCRVAPNTTGGSGIIAAYDDANGTGNILWSWHIWVTDYSPSPTGNQSVDDPLKRKQKYTNRTTGQLPMMDRNLGAIAGYTDVPPSALEMSKTHGFHYQWGRKDLFPSCYTSDPTKIEVVAKDLSKPIEGLLNLYQPDGLSYYQRGIEISDKYVDFQTAYRHPATLYKPNSYLGWSQLDNLKTAWGGNYDKTIHDPCPAGWRITKIDDYKALFQSEPSINTNALINVANENFSTDGGAVVRFESNEEKSRTTYIRFTGYWVGTYTYGRIGQATLMWCRDNIGALGGGNISGRYFNINLTDGGNKGVLNYFGYIKEAIPVRCIQERE